MELQRLLRFRPGVTAFAFWERPGLTVEGRAEPSHEPLTGPDCSSTKIRSAMSGFAPEVEVGRSSGRSDAFGLSYEASYAETAEHVFSSEETEGPARDVPDKSAHQDRR
jgi:hypothetical protein